MLAFSAAFAAAPLVIQTGSPTADRARLASFASGIGASFVAGKGGAYSPAFAERMVLSLSMGEASALSLEVDHARHTLANASGLYPEFTVAADAASGYRDFLTLELGGRIGLSFSERLPSDQIRAWPWLWIGAGCAFTDTSLEIPGFVGGVSVRTRATTPMATLGGGAEIRLKPWLSVHPGFKAQFLVANDHGEVDHLDKWGVTVRGQAAVDVAIDF